MMNGVMCMVYGVWCMVYGVWCMVYGVWRMAYGVGCGSEGVESIFYEWERTSERALVVLLPLRCRVQSFRSAVEPIWQVQDSQGQIMALRQILALAFRLKSILRF